MKRLLIPACLALAPLLFARLEENLPAETYGLLKIENIAKTRARLDAHPVSRGPGAERFKEFIAPLIDKAKSKDPAAYAEFERARDAALKHFDGEFVWAVVRTRDPLPHHLPFDFVVLARTEADETTLADFLKDVKLLQPTPPAGEKTPAPETAAPKPASDDEGGEDAPVPAKSDVKPEPAPLESVEEEFSGVKLHLLVTKVGDEPPVSSGGWAVVDKTFLYASAPNVLKELVEARKTGRKDAFTDAPLWRSAKDALDDRDAWLLLNVPLVAASAREAIVKALDERKKAGEAPLGGGMFDPLKTFDAMAFDNITQLRMTVSLKPDDTRADSALLWNERKGFVNLIRYKADAAPEIGLAPADAVAADAGRVDLAATFATLETMLREALPFAAPMLDLQLDKLKNEEGLDIRTAILANLGDSVVTVTGEAPAGAVAAAPEKAAELLPQVWIVTLLDETKLASFIETGLGKIAAKQTGDGAKSVFEERELLGVKVREFKGGGAAVPRITYALCKNRLVIGKGDPALFDKVVAQILSPKPGLDATPAHRAAIARLPEGGCAVNHADLGRLAGFLGEQFVRMSKNAGDEFSPDPAKAPRAGDFPFVIVGKSYASETGVESHAVLAPKSGDDTAK